MALKRDSIEIERKFLIAEMPPEIEGLNGTFIRQGYLAVDHNREVRIRNRAGNCLLTVKDAGTGLGRREVEVHITPEQFDALWPLTAGRNLTKTRYEVPFQDWTLEIDVFDGDLEPLCLGEVEFPTEAASRQFCKPACFGQEVTHLPEFRNVQLAKHGIPAIRGGDGASRKDDV